MQTTVATDVEARRSLAARLLERQLKEIAMLMRFEPFRAFDRSAEDLPSAARGRLIPVDAYRRGDEFKVHLDRVHIAAAYEDGVLTITIPVVERAKPRKVEVSHAGGAAQALEPASAAA